MKVRALIEKLQAMDPDLNVFGYNGDSEDGTSIDRAEVTKDFPYCKADPPYGVEDGKPFVLLW